MYALLLAPAKAFGNTPAVIFYLFLGKIAIFLTNLCILPYTYTQCEESATYSKKWPLKSQRSYSFAVFCGD